MKNKLDTFFSALRYGVPLVVFSLLFIVYPCNLSERGIHYFPFYIAGYCAYRNDLFLRLARSSRDMSAVLFMFVVASILYDWYSADYLNVSNKIYKYPAGFAAMVILYKLSCSINYANRLNIFLTYCGRRSIVIYLTHF